MQGECANFVLKSARTAEQNAKNINTWNIVLNVLKHALLALMNAEKCQQLKHNLKVVLAKDIIQYGLLVS